MTLRTNGACGNGPFIEPEGVCEVDAPGIQSPDVHAYAYARVCCRTYRRGRVSHFSMASAPNVAESEQTASDTVRA
jgi:hypothetical protein